MVPEIRRKMLRRVLNLPEYLESGFQAAYQAVSIPLGYEGGSGTLVADVVVHPRPPHTGKSSTHRVFVVCPTCRREIPAGRWHQHAPVHRKEA